MSFICLSCIPISTAEIWTLSVWDANTELSLFVGKASENVWGDYCEADAVCFGM